MIQEMCISLCVSPVFIIEYLSNKALWAAVAMKCPIQIKPYSPVTCQCLFLFWDTLLNLAIMSFMLKCVDVNVYALLWIVYSVQIWEKSIKRTGKKKLPKIIINYFWVMTSVKCTWAGMNFHAQNFPCASWFDTLLHDVDQRDKEEEEGSRPVLLMVDTTKQIWDNYNFIVSVKELSEN